MIINPYMFGRTIDRAFFAFRSSDGMLDAGGNVASNAEAVAYLRNLSAGATAAPNPYQQVTSWQPIATVGTPSFATFDGIDNRIMAGPWKGPLFAATTLPNGGLGAETDKGWTCTGLARKADGSWWVGNDGRPGTAASLINLSEDFTTIISQIDFLTLYGYSGTIQGVAVDPRDGEVWVVFKDDGDLRKIDPTDGSTSQTYDFAALGLGDPNGLAWDPTNNTLICCTSSTIRRINPDTLAVSSITTLPGGFASDHFHVTSDGTIYVTRAVTSTSPGSIWKLTAAIWNKVADLPEADSIEGLWISDDKTRIVVCNDAYFHGGSPALNRILDYRGSFQTITASVIELCAIVDLTSAPATAARTILAVGVTYSLPGVALESGLSSTTQMVVRLYGPGGNGTKAFTVSDMTAGPTLIRARVDMAGGVIRLWQDGVELTPEASTVAGTSITLDGYVQVGGDVLNTTQRFYPGKIYGASIAFDVTEAQGLEIATAIQA